MLLFWSSLSGTVAGSAQGVQGAEISCSKAGVLSAAQPEKGLHPGFCGCRIVQFLIDLGPKGFSSWLLRRTPSDPCYLGLTTVQLVWSKLDTVIYGTLLHLRYVPLVRRLPEPPLEKQEITQEC